MKYRDILGKNRNHVWVGDSKTVANDMIDHGIRASHGELGHGFYASATPQQPADDGVVLEYRVAEAARILDLSDEADMLLWQSSGAGPYLDTPSFWKRMKRRGIDAVKNSEMICFYNAAMLTFTKVYAGVVDDPLEATDTKELDEIALGGLQRCTAVTVNALLKDFHLPPLTLGEVPVDNPGVLRILTTHGLAYRPFLEAAGRTVQQFANLHRREDWYLLTPGHAMALIRGELFDAENKGPDSRKLQAAFQITRR